MSKSRLFVVALLPAFVFGCQAAPTSTAAHTATHPAAATPTPVPEFWSEKGLLLTPADFGHPEFNGQSFADSDIVKLPDGRLRIYMTLANPTGTSGGLVSMQSKDGLRWTLEPGYRCTYTLPACSQVTVVKLPTGGWRMFGGTGAGIASAFSSDGLSWTAEPGLRVSSASLIGGAGERISGPHITEVAGGGWRMYFHKEIHFPTNCGPGTGIACPGYALGVLPVRILSAFSTDLAQWTPDPGIRSTAGLHPGIVPLPAGGYQMFADAGFGLVTATSPDGLTWPPTFTKTFLQGGDPDPVVLPDGSVRIYYNDADFLAHQGGGLYWAEQERATWDVNFDTRIDSTTVRVTGSGAAVTVRVTDHGRSQDRPVNGLPHTARPPFQVVFALPQPLAYQPVIEVSDGSMNRYFDAYNLPELSSCGLGSGTPCQPTNCGPGFDTPCPPTNCGAGTGTPCPIPCGTGPNELPCSLVRNAPPCQTGQPVGPKGCIVTNQNGVQEYCPPKNNVDPAAVSDACKPFYQNGS